MSLRVDDLRIPSQELEVTFEVEHGLSGFAIIEGSVSHFVGGFIDERGRLPDADADVGAMLDRATHVRVRWSDGTEIECDKDALAAALPMLRAVKERLAAERPAPEYLLFFPDIKMPSLHSTLNDHRIKQVQHLAVDVEGKAVRVIVARCTHCTARFVGRIA